MPNFLLKISNIAVPYCLLYRFMASNLNQMLFIRWKTIKSWLLHYTVWLPKLTTFSPSTWFYHQSFQKLEKTKKIRISVKEISIKTKGEKRKKDCRRSLAAMVQSNTQSLDWEIVGSNLRFFALGIGTLML